MGSDLFSLGAFFNSGDDDSGDDDSGDIMGDDSGDEIGDIIGALTGALRKRGVRAPARKPVPRGYNPRVVNYTPTKYETLRHLVLGFTSNGTVAAAATANITNQPQLPFQGTRLIVPSSIAPSFLIQDFKIGNASQLAAGGALPALVFAENATAVVLKLDMASVSQIITLSVTNTSGGALQFSAALMGDAMTRLVASSHTFAQRED